MSHYKLISSAVEETISSIVYTNRFYHCLFIVVSKIKTFIFTKNVEITVDIFEINVII